MTCSRAAVPCEPRISRSGTLWLCTQRHWKLLGIAWDPFPLICTDHHWSLNHSRLNSILYPSPTEPDWAMSRCAFRSLPIRAIFHLALLMPLLQSSQGQEDLPAWLFKATLVDTLHLPAGTQGSDLLADATFREFVRNLFSGALVLPMIHIPPSAFKLENATVLEDVYSEAINAHGGVGHGKKSVRFEAVVTVSSRPVPPLALGLFFNMETFDGLDGFRETCWGLYVLFARFFNKENCSWIIDGSWSFQAGSRHFKA